MIAVSGIFHHLVLAIHLDKTFLKHVTMPVVSAWFLELTNLSWRNTVGVMIRMWLPFLKVHPITYCYCWCYHGILDDTLKYSFPQFDPAPCGGEPHITWCRLLPNNHFGSCRAGLLLPDCTQTRRGVEKVTGAVI
ncbi:hypothetical protein GH733_015285, partial [Mirounga leonina]